MIFQYICPPAALYLAFSLIQILIDMFRGETNIAFLKFLVMIVFTIALNMLCTAGLGLISWLIVFIPFILMTYITTILVFVFGIPNKENISTGQPDPRPERKRRNEHSRNWWKDHQHIGGCAGTLFGCCEDGETAKRNLAELNLSEIGAAGKIGAAESLAVQKGIKASLENIEQQNEKLLTYSGG